MEPLTFVCTRDMICDSPRSIPSCQSKRGSRGIVTRDSGNVSEARTKVDSGTETRFIRPHPLGIFRERGAGSELLLFGFDWLAPSLNNSVSSNFGAESTKRLKGVNWRHFIILSDGIENVLSTLIAEH
jgi:hypothetical protein